MRCEMDDIKEFQKRINDTIKFANKQGNKIAVQKIRDLFADMKLSDKQYEQINAYLSDSNIIVEGYKRESMNSTSLQNDNCDILKDAAIYPSKHINAEDSMYLKQYYEELDKIKKSSEQEELQLLSMINKGDITAEGRFIEINLVKVVEIAKEYRNQGMTMEDLIQEGNISLIQALKELPNIKNLEEIKGFVYEFIQKGIITSLKEQQYNDNLENTVMGKSNLMLKALKELEKNLGKKVNIHEFAEYTNLTEDEIKNIIGLSADAIKLEH
jgi:RNA polymerase primary sigma factor